MLLSRNVTHHDAVRNAYVECVYVVGGRLVSLVSLHGHCLLARKLGFLLWARIVLIKEFKMELDRNENYFTGVLKENNRRQAEIPTSC